MLILLQAGRMGSTFGVMTQLPSPCVFATNDTGAGVWDWLLHDESVCVFCRSSRAEPSASSFEVADGMRVSDSMYGHRVGLCLDESIPGPRHCIDHCQGSEAVDAHTPACTHDSCSCIGAAPVTLSDDCQTSLALIPAYRHHVDVCAGCGVFDSIIDDWFPCLLTDFMLVSPLHPSSRAWLSHLPQSPQECDLLYHVYVDGTGLSDAHHAPAWGIAVFRGGSVDVMNFIGFAGGPVVTDPEDDAFIGASGADSMSAELSATAWALLYILACVPAGAQCEILYDSEYAAGAASSRARISAHVDLSRIVSSLFHLASLRVAVSMSHIKSHCGQPGNEFVDCVANGFLIDLWLG